MRLYAIQYALMADVEAEMDDPSYDTLEMLASPQVAALATDETLEEKIEAVQRGALEELEDSYGDADTARHVLDCARWERGVWDVPEIGRRNLTISLWDRSADGEELVRIVVQEMEG